MEVESQLKKKRSKRTNPVRNARRRERHWNLKLAIQLGTRKAPSTSEQTSSNVISAPYAPPIRECNLLPADLNRPFECFEWEKSSQQLSSSHKKKRRKKKLNRGPNLQEMEIYFPTDRIDDVFWDHYTVPYVHDLTANRPINFDLVPQIAGEKVPIELYRKMEMDRVFNNFAFSGQ